jgi:putative glutamine amidotransferase
MKEDIYMETKKLRIAIPEPWVVIDNYKNAMTELGAEPVVVDDLNCDPADYDGLLLPGGADVNPARYGMENTASAGIDDERDELQFTVLDRFAKAGKPVFGICRGHQVINVYFGGTLIQHLPTSDCHRRDPGSEQDKVHKNTAEAGSFAAELYGTEFYTNSAHHQAADRIGEGLRVVMRAEDGTVEALCHESKPVWSLQWHPERMCYAHHREDTVDGSIVLKFFVEQCEKCTKTNGEN